MESPTNNSTWCFNNSVDLAEACFDMDKMPPCCYPGFSESFTEFASVYYLTIGLIGTVENVLNFVVLTYAWWYHFSDSSSPGNNRNFNTLLLISYSCSEMAYCSFVLPLIGMTYYHRGWPYGPTLCATVAYLRRTLGLTSWNTIAAMIFSRALHYWFPSAHFIIFETMGGIPAISCLWIISFAVFVLILKHEEVVFGYNASLGQCLIRSGKNKEANLLVGLSDIVPFFVTIISFVLLWVKLHLSRISVTSVPETGSSTVDKLLSRERRMAVLFTFLAASFILPLLPVVVIYFCCWKNSSSTLFAYVHIVAITYVIINFCVYFLRVSFYRSAFCFFFRSMSRKLHDVFPYK